MNTTPAVPFRHAWCDLPWLTLDTETTAKEPHKARLIEVALYACRAGEPPVSLLEAVVNPGVEVPQEVVTLTGITNERVRAEGRDTREVLEALQSYLGPVHGGTQTPPDRPLIIYNAGYDLTVLREETKRVGFNWRALLEHNPVVLDPLVLDRAFDTYRKGSRKLSDVAALYRSRGHDIPEGRAHGAAADCLMAEGITRALLKEYPVLGGMTLTDLHGFQSRAWQAWADNYNGYLSRSGQKHRVRGTWLAPQPDEA